MRTLVVLEDFVYGAGRDDAAAVPQFEASGEVGAFAGARQFDGRRREKQRDDPCRAC